MTATVLHLTSLSAKVALLGGIAWVQLYLLRRASASSRSRLCSLALVAILLFGAGEMLAPQWMVKAPVFTLTAAAAPRGSTASAPIPVTSWLTWAWMAGAGFMLLRAVVGRTAITMVRMRSRLLERVEGVDVQNANVQTPMLAGLWRPAILLPEAACDWTEEQRGMVLTHELTHFRQGDVWTNLLAQILRAVFWFHPVVWLLVARLSREQELTCDEAVLAAGHSGHDYAAFLLAEVRNLKSSEMFSCAMAGSGAQSLKQRFAHLLDPMPRPALTRRIAVALASLALVVMTLTAVRPVWSQSQGGREVYKVGNGVTSPKVLNIIHPDYTEEARAGKIEGTVLVKAVITEEGTADSIEVVKGIDAGLDQRAMDALSRWTFEPGTKDGKPVAVWATIEINFRLK